MRMKLEAWGFLGNSEQEVRTPPYVIRIVMRAFAGGIALDPCAPTRAQPSFEAARYVREAEDGLALPWVDRTYVNPPFGNLAPWLAKASIEGSPQCRIVMLVPVRTHRRWFRSALRSADASGGGIFFLDPVKFLGHSAGFPAPLCLMAWGCKPEVPL